MCSVSVYKIHARYLGTLKVVWYLWLFSFMDNCLYGQFILGILLKQIL